MNPWLEISLEDYEGHMAHPTVVQGDYLAVTLERFVQDYAPKSVAVIGCAGGNGFERLPSDKICRLVGVDINPHYLAEARHRYSNCFQRLELICEDVASPACCFDPVDLIFAGLVFEYVDIRATLTCLRRLTRPGGLIAVVLQLSGDSIKPITPSPYASLAKLGPCLRLVSPERMLSVAANMGFGLRSNVRRVLSTGKGFQELLFETQHHVD